MSQTMAKRLEVEFTQTNTLPIKLRKRFAKINIIENPFHHPEPLDTLLRDNHAFSNDVWNQVFDSLFQMKPMSVDGKYGRLTLKPS